MAHWDATINERVRRWLGSVPRPQAVIGELSDGSKRRVAVPVRGKLIDVASALDGCVRIEAIDSKDQILRMMDLDDVVKVEQGEPPPDMNRGELGQIARIISDAHDRGARVANEANKVGYETVAKLLTMTLDRLSALEKQAQVQIAAQARDNDRRSADLDRREVEVAALAEDKAEGEGLNEAAAEVVKAAAPALASAFVEKMFGTGTTPAPSAPNGATQS